MRKILSILSIATASLLVTVPASASLINSTVTGSITYPPYSFNFNTQISGGGPEFFVSTTTPSPSTNVNSYYVDFNGGVLKIIDVAGNLGSAAGQYIFTDAAFAGLTLAETSDNFLNGGATATLVGTTLTVNIPGFDGPAGTYSANYSFTAAVPEPTTVALLGLGLLGVAASRRKAAKK